MITIPRLAKPWANIWKDNLDKIKAREKWKDGEIRV